MKNYSLFILSLFISLVSFAQSGKTVTGVITDAASGEPLVAAAVRETATPQNGVTTDVDGKFSIKLTKGNELTVSYLGYETQRVSVASGNNFKIELKESGAVLEEAVVIGYGGTQLRSKLTNSISKVKDETLTSGMHSNVGQALSGTVPGLRVIQSSGNPNTQPTIILRGGTDYAGTGSPLYVIDGMIRDNMLDVNPNDIESIEVMKDAGATAIYGARANNGVVMITTKRGKEGRTQISLNAKWSLNFFSDTYDFLSAGDYLYYQRLAYKRAADLGTNTLTSLSAATPYGTGNDYYADGNVSSTGIWGVYNYSDDLAFLLNQGYRTMTDPVYGGTLLYTENYMKDFNINTPSLSQDYNLSVSGGNDRGHYYAGMGWNKSEGNAIDNYNQRASIMFNADYKIKPWLLSNSSFNLSDTKYMGLPLTNSSESNYFSRSFSYPPTYRAYNTNGELILGTNASDGNQEKNINNYWRDYDRQKISVSQALTFTLMPGLTFKLQGDWYYEFYNYQYFYRTYQTGPNSYNTRHNSYAEHDKYLTQTYNALLNYNKSFGKHNLSALLGFEYFDKGTFGFSASGYNPANNYFADLSYTITDAGARTIDSWHSDFRTESYFMRINYDYEDKYLASFTLRTDGISKLAKDVRWGWFPGVSLGWVFQKEKFMEKYADILTFGKLRASFGLNGNVNDSYVGNYTIQGAYDLVTYNGTTGYALGTIPNPYLTWESSRTFEIGLDLGFLRNRLTAGITWYDRRTTDKYANITLPASSGVTTAVSNNGTFQNRGWEFDFNYRILDTKDWKVQAGLNAAYNINTVLKLPDNGYDKNRQSGIQVYDSDGNLKWVGGYAEGERPGDLYVFKALGIYKSDDEIPAGLIDRTTSNNGGSNKVLYAPDVYVSGTGLPIQAGDVKWLDVNGDNVIDNYDKVKVGNLNPKWTGGFNASASWKGIILSARFDFALGFKTIDYRTMWIMGDMQGSFNTIGLVKDTWSESNPNAKYPIYIWADQLNKRNYDRYSTLFVYNGDYLAIREISLGYTLPAKLIKMLHLEKLDVSVAGQNLGYITEAPYLYSPEVSSNSSGYPLPKMLVFSLNVTF